MDTFTLGAILLCLYIPIQVLAVHEYTKCANASVPENLPVATFCTNSEAEGVRIVLDGYFANTIPDKVCSCVVQKGQAQKIVFSDVNFLPSPIQNGDWCGSKIVAKQDNGQSNHMECRVLGSLNLQDDNDIQISLRKQSQPGDTRYCALVYFDTDEPIQMSCFSNDVTTTSMYDSSMISTTDPSTMRPSYLAGTTTVDMLKETSRTMTSHHVTVKQSKLIETITPLVSTTHMDPHSTTIIPLTEKAAVIMGTTDTSISVVASSKESTTLTYVQSDTTSSTVTRTIKIKTTGLPEPITTIVNEQTIDDKILYIGILVGCGALVIIIIILIGASIRKKIVTSKVIELKAYVPGEENGQTTVNVTKTSTNNQRNGVNNTSGTADMSSKHKPEFIKSDEYNIPVGKNTDYVPPVKTVDSLYVVVDRSKKKQSKDSVNNGVKGHTTAEKTNINGLLYVELELSPQPSTTDKPNVTHKDSVDYAEVMLKM